MEQSMNDHIDNRTLAAFLDNALDAEAKKNVLNHLRGCDECRLKMAETSIFIREMAPKPANNPYLRILKLATPFIAAGLVAILVLPMSNFHDSEPQIDATETRSVPERHADAYVPRPMSKRYGYAGAEPQMAQAPETYAVAPETEEIIEMAVMDAGEPYEEDTMAALEEQLKTVYFEAEGDALSDTMKEAIAYNVALIRDTDYSILLEGNADDSKPLEYSFALALRYADSVKQHMIALGIDEDRIRMLSYGNDRPVCMEETPECQAKNRYVMFKLKP